MKLSTGKKTDCYVDTSAFIAFLDRSDTYHASFAKLFSTPPRLVTSSLVIGEGHGWFLRRYDQSRAIQFLAFIEALPVLTIQPFDTAELASTTAIIRKFADQKLTLADAHGLRIMRALRIACCWSTDRHLGLEGVRMVI
jgi:predicted nucleic acid-binding protein